MQEMDVGLPGALQVKLQTSVGRRSRAWQELGKTGKLYLELFAHWKNAGRDRPDDGSRVSREVHPRL